MVADKVFSVRVRITPDPGNFICGHAAEIESDREAEYKF